MVVKCQKLTEKKSSLTKDKQRIKGNAPLIPEQAIIAQSLIPILYSYFLGSFINGKNIKTTTNQAKFIKIKKRTIARLSLNNLPISIKFIIDNISLPIITPVKMNKIDSRQKCTKDQTVSRPSSKFSSIIKSLAL